MIRCYVLKSKLLIDKLHYSINKRIWPFIHISNNSISLYTEFGCDSIYLPFGRNRLETQKSVEIRNAAILKSFEIRRYFSFRLFIKLVNSSKLIAWTWPPETNRNINNHHLTDHINGSLNFVHLHAGYFYHCLLM